ncbi:winged helix-turn-helix domain-containing protein [Sphingomonas alba]|uniref:Winged helix-turn-helix domain-containing protein n=1 Tax=Sphingomonas alba TaxID=2908208 RepID=A0ABT0RNV1_9SPHN|nr:winged helix-turn-helix domain-containing protein [Sphingomonas alba]MCL6684245.1 winged helix-turn-helix domain-containing protein [Sphingomonas alba]
MECTPVILAHETPFSIGAVEISPSTRELRNNGKSAILEPRVMQVLVALHRAQGAVVSKDDLVACCWDGRIVGDDAINRVIGRLRHDASDHADDAFRVETITRVGYRMVENGANRTPNRVDRRFVIGGAVAAAAAAAATFGWQNFRSSPANKEAAELLEESRIAMLQGLPDQLGNAVAKLKRASEIEPGNAEIWGTLALAYTQQRGSVPAAQQPFVAERAKNAGARALSIDPDNGNGLAAQALSQPFFRNWLAMEKAARRALQRQPRNFALNKLLGFVLGSVGRPAAAIPYLDRAQQAEPMAVGLYVSRMFTYWYAGRLDDAEKTIEHAASLWPRYFGVWFSQIYLLAYTGRAQQALTLVEDTASRPNGIPDWNFDFTSLQVKALATGRPDDLEKAMESCREIAKRGEGFAENVILFAGAVGRIDDAYRVLDAYYFDRGFKIADKRWSTEQGMYGNRRERDTHFLFHPALLGIRRDPRFPGLTKAIGLDDYWQRSGTKPDYVA